MGERWTFLILREALGGRARFSQFREVLGIASDVLANRLGMLVDAGLMERREYREPGSRTRTGYHLTDAGHELVVAVAALQQWGDRHRPSDLPSLHFTGPDGAPLAVRFVDGRGRHVDPPDVLVEDGRGPAAPS